MSTRERITKREKNERKKRRERGEKEGEKRGKRGEKENKWVLAFDLQVHATLDNLWHYIAPARAGHMRCRAGGEEDRVLGQRAMQ